MGLFHCPLGAVGFGQSGCIQCGLCAAQTREEKLKATSFVRAWIKEHNYQQHPDLLIRKIAVCGKGGAGKSTLTALFSGALEQLGYQTLVIDTDSSNGGLWRKLGMARPPQALSEAAEQTPRALGFLTQEPLYFEDIPERYYQRNGERILMLAGKIEDPLLGCACTVGAFAKELIGNLTPKSREIVLADQEAGVESFGRGIEQDCDTILILVEPSSESLALAEKIQYMAQGLGIMRIRAVLNKVEDQEQQQFLQAQLSQMGIRFLGALPRMAQISKKNLYGQPLTAAFSYAQAGTLVRLMLDEAEMRYSLPQ